MSSDGGVSYSPPQCPVSCIGTPASPACTDQELGPLAGSQDRMQEALPPNCVSEGPGGEAQNLLAGWGPISLDPVLGLDLGVFPGLACPARREESSQGLPRKAACPPLSGTSTDTTSSRCRLSRSAFAGLCDNLPASLPLPGDPLSPHPPEGEDSTQWALVLGGLG